MKKIFLLLLLLFTITAPHATAATPVVRITDRPHVNFVGNFIDNDLATDLLPEGRLGALVSSFSSAKKTWVIDPALIDEITLMANGYSVNGKEDKDGELAAQNWLARLKFSIGDNQVISLPYGNPDQLLAKRLAPSELRFYSAYGKTRLEGHLGRTVSTENGWGKGVSRLSYPLKALYSNNRRALTGLSTLTSAQEVLDLRARLAIVMNPELDKRAGAVFSYSASVAVKNATSKLRVSPGRYQLTSTNSKVPVTLINNFDTPTVVSVSLIPMNSRVQIEDIYNVELAAKSRQQISIDVSVVAPGTTLVYAQFVNSKGQLVGEQSELNLNATIIDSRVAWFTTGAAVLLFIGAIAQSVRRIRRSRNEK
jgi:hypothetical protein